MADIGVFPAELETALSSPDVHYSLLAKFVFGDGEGGTITRRFHRGQGTVAAGGFKWEGVSDPGQTRLTKISAVEMPTPNVAAKIDLTLTGVDRGLLARLRADVRIIYTAECELYAQVVNPDTRDLIGNPVTIFPNGRCGMPRFEATGAGVRIITIPVDGIWANKNFAPGGRLNDADQKSRYAGDRGLELVGSPAYELVK